MFVIADKKIDNLGRIVIPADLRHKLGLKNQAIVSICVNASGNIELVPKGNYCFSCKSTDNLLIFNDSYICVRCQTEISKINLVK